MREITLRPYEVIVVHRIAYTAIVTEKGWIVGKATEDMPGYTPTLNGIHEKQAPAQKIARELNESIGMDEETAAQIVLSTMRSGVKRS